MAEYISTSAQTVSAGGSVALNTSISGGCYIMHHNGSPVVSLRGSGCCKSPNIYRATAHVTITAASTTPVQMALAVDGVTLPETLIAFPPVASGTVLSGSTSAEIMADCGCSKVSLVAVTDATVSTASLIIDRV